jgi:hypothetical protein
MIKQEIYELILAVSFTLWFFIAGLYASNTFEEFMLWFVITVLIDIIIITFAEFIFYRKGEVK